VDVLVKHPLAHTLDLPVDSVFGCENYGRKHSVSGDARDHIVPGGVRVSAIHHLIWEFARYDQRSLGRDADTNVSLVEEQQLRLREPHELSARVGDGHAHFLRN